MAGSPPTWQRRACVCAFLLASIASAQDSLCADAWGRPSADNSVDDCINDGAVQNKLFMRVIPLLLPMVLGVLTFVFCPCFLAGRYCCGACGSAKQRPGHFCCGGEDWDEREEIERLRAYSAAELMRAKYSAIGVALIGAVCVALFFTSAKMFSAAYDDLWGGIFGGIDWVISIVQDVQAAVTHNGGLIPPFTTETFQDIFDKIVDVRKGCVDARRDLKEFFNSEYFWYTAYIGIVPSAVILATALPALFRVRRYLPLFFFCINMLFLLVYSIVFSGTLVVNYAVNVGCAELDAQVSRSPGIAQWALIPRCEEHAPFDSITEKITEAKSESAQQTCAALQAFCNTDPYTTARPNDVFYCDMSALNCTSYADIDAFVVGSVTVKAGAPSPCTGSNGNTPCTVRRCSLSCGDTSVRSRATDVLDGLAAGAAAIAADAILRPILTCNALADKVIEFFPVCPKLRAGFGLLSGAFAAICVGLACASIVLMRGQKRFFKPPDGEDSMNLLDVPMVPVGFKVRKDDGLDPPPEKLRHEDSTFV